MDESKEISSMIHSQTNTYELKEPKPACRALAPVKKHYSGPTGRDRSVHKDCPQSYLQLIHIGKLKNVQFSQMESQ